MPSVKSSWWWERFPLVAAAGSFVRARIVQGILLLLPVVVTLWVLHYLYSTARVYLIDPIAQVVVGWARGNLFHLGAGEDLPPLIENLAAPVIALAIVVTVLYFCGMFFQSRLHKALDWLLLRVPLVTTIYSAVQKVVSSFQDSSDGKRKFQRIVLVKFPHPGMRVPGFVTGNCIDQLTGKKILCIYVPTTPVPTSGYMLMVPEEDVVDLKWDVNETLQAIVSGGITIPKTVNYYTRAMAAEEGLEVAIPTIEKPKTESVTTEPPQRETAGTIRSGTGPSSSGTATSNPPSPNDPSRPSTPRDDRPGVSGPKADRPPSGPAALSDRGSTASGGVETVADRRPAEAHVAIPSNSPPEHAGPSNGRSARDEDSPPRSSGPVRPEMYLLAADTEDASTAQPRSRPPQRSDWPSVSGENRSGETRTTNAEGSSSDSSRPDVGRSDTSEDRGASRRPRRRRRGGTGRGPRADRSTRDRPADSSRASSVDRPRGRRDRPSDSSS